MLCCAHEKVLQEIQLGWIACLFVLQRLNVCYGKNINYFAGPVTDTTAIFGSVTSHSLDILSWIHLRRTWGYRIHNFGTNMSYPNQPHKSIKCRTFLPNCLCIASTTELWCCTRTINTYTWLNMSISSIKQDIHGEQKCLVNGIETFLIWKSLIYQIWRLHGFVWGSAVSLPGLRPNPYSSVTG